MEWITKILMCLIAVYWTGARIRANPHVEQLILATESGFKELTLSLKELKILSALNFLSKLYGIVAFVGFLGMLLLTKIDVDAGVRDIFILVFGVALVMFGSIKWVLGGHKTFLTSNKLLVFVFVSWPFFLAWLEFSQGVPVLKEAFSTFNRFLTLSGFGDFSGYSIWIKSGMLSAFSVVMMLFYYSVTWGFSLFFTLISICLVLCPVYLAKLIDKAWPTDTFFFFTIIVFFVLTMFS